MCKHVEKTRSMVAHCYQLNLNHRCNFKPHFNFIFGIKIKSKLTFQIDIRNQIDFCFYLHFVFHFFSFIKRTTAATSRLTISHILIRENISA